MSFQNGFGVTGNAMRALALLCSVAVVACVGQANSVAAQGLRAGAAQVDITPKESELPIKTDSIRDHLFVRAIVVDSDNQCAVIIGMDQGATMNDMYDAAVPQIVSATGCRAENILISATHTHSGATNGLSGSPNTETVVQAVVKAATEAKANLRPATVGYGRTTVDLNVNRDLFNSKLEWRQEPNPHGPSDKTLSVIEFLGADYVPIAVYMNYAMHPINFYLSGVISADFPGEASRFVEDHFDHKTVAIFSQGTSGDQNPRLYDWSKWNISAWRGDKPPSGPERIGAPPEPAQESNFVPAAAQAGLKAVPDTSVGGYQKAIERTGARVAMMGTLIGEKTLNLMRTEIHPTTNARIWGGQENFTCPGRDRQDKDNPIRENGMPPYADGPDVKLRVSLVRIGDIYITGVDGEVYTNIGLKLKAAAPANNLIISTLTNGMANSGYIYSDDAYSHLTFQVIGSRLKPGCAENKIVGSALDLMRKSEK